MLTKEEREKIIAQFAQGEHDTGSPDVQIALLTARIKYLTGHLIANKKDKATQRGLLKLVHRRRRLLRYLGRQSPARYRAIKETLGIRR